MIKLHLKSIIAVLFFSITVSAQKVKWDNDTVYKNSAPYCLIKKSGGMLVTYSVQTLNGKEVAISKVDEDLKDNSGYPFYRVTFTGTGSIASLPNGLNFGNKLAKACVENDIIAGDSINAAGESRFLVVYPQKHAGIQNLDLTNGASGGNYTMVTRDRKGIITVVGVSVKQNGTEVGSCVEKSNASGGKVIKTVSFYLANGTLCAEARFEGVDATACTITTFKDTGTHILTIQNMAAKNQEIAKWLVDNYYL